MEDASWSLMKTTGRWESCVSTAGIWDSGREAITHRQDKIMFDFLQVAQREDEALWVPLTLPDQEQAARREGNISRGHTAATFTQGLSYPWACCSARPCRLPVYQALLCNEPLAFLAGNASMEPWLGAVDGWGEGNRRGVTPGRGSSY